MKAICPFGVIFLVGAPALTHGMSILVPETSRRNVLKQVSGGILATQFLGDPALADPTSTTTDTGGELPSVLKDYTKLAPLGKKGSMGPKTRGLSLEDLAQRLAHDLTEGSTGQGGYFVTGDLSSNLFRDDAVFSDPTNRVNSLKQYQTALRILFDPQTSVVELLTPQLQIDHDARTLTGQLRSRGYLQLPWKPYVTAYETTIVYTIDDDGLVARQDQTWSKSATQALQESFNPTGVWVGPPPLSHRPIPPTEPPVVSQLFSKVNGRRPYEYSPRERQEISQLISQIVNAPPKESNAAEISSSLPLPFDRSLLPGRWMLVFLQAGPNGAGIDRRIPFPEFDFNDSFQLFGSDSVVNLGQLLGPWVDVRVSGRLKEVESAPASPASRQRLQANIEGGTLCIGDPKTALTDRACFQLPIQGEGLFESLYLGERLRIAQNINGGGARLIQVRLDDTAPYPPI